MSNVFRYLCGSKNKNIETITATRSVVTLIINGRKEQITELYLPSPYNVSVNIAQGSVNIFTNIQARGEPNDQTPVQVYTSFANMCVRHLGSKDLIKSYVTELLQ